MNEIVFLCSFHQFYSSNRFLKGNNNQQPNQQEKGQDASEQVPTNIQMVSIGDRDKVIYLNRLRAFK